MLALTREISTSLARCELTHIARMPIDVARACEQHAAYERALQSCGCTVCRLPADASMPDSVFIEDTAVVVPELAVIARPGAPSRRAETVAVAAALETVRPLAAIEEPGTLDGGDVLVSGRTVFVGQSNRTNSEAVSQLRVLLAPYGYQVRPVQPHGCLHLKSAVTTVSAAAVLINPAWVSPREFSEVDVIEVAPEEPGAANVVSIDGRVIASAAYPRTIERLARRGVDVLVVDASELAKAEGALTCCSLLVTSHSVIA